MVVVRSDCDFTFPFRLIWGRICFNFLYLDVMKKLKVPRLFGLSFFILILPKKINKTIMSHFSYPSWKYTNLVFDLNFSKL